MAVGRGQREVKVKLVPVPVPVPVPGTDYYRAPFPGSWESILGLVNDNRQTHNDKAIKLPTELVIQADPYSH